AAALTGYTRRRDRQRATARRTSSYGPPARRYQPYTVASCRGDAIPATGSRISPMRTHPCGLIAVTITSLVAMFATPTAQSPNAFGRPTADKPSPGAEIKAVPGSRAQGWLSQGRSEVLARHGMVATSDPLAAEAGLEILRQGGNAIDAAVATGAVLDVTSQNDTGIGGDLFALVYVAKDKKLYALNSGGWAPSGWTPEFFSKLGGRGVPNNGVNSATVPGAISGYDALLKRFGSLGFKETFERAARIAEEGWGLAERRHPDRRGRSKG